MNRAQKIITVPVLSGNFLRHPAASRHGPGGYDRQRSQRVHLNERVAWSRLSTSPCARRRESVGSVMSGGGVILVRKTRECSMV